MVQTSKTGLILIFACVALQLLSMALYLPEGGSGTQEFVAGILGGISAGCGLIGVYLIARQMRGAK